MAGGLRDVLAAQGVIPLSAPVSVTAGMRLGQLTGSWITGGTAVSAGPGTVSWGPLSGFWINAAPAFTVDAEIGDGGHFKRPHGAFITEPGELPRTRKDLQRMAVMAVLAINEYYD